MGTSNTMQMAEKLNALGEHLAKTLGEALADWEIAYNELTLTVTREQIADVIRTLRDDPKCLFTCLIDVCGVDYPSRVQRFDVVYHLLSPQLNHRVRVRTLTDEVTPVPSIIDIFPAANWFERETYDMYGVLFSGHPDLRRLLTDYGFQGHPLRKDFPLTGFVEVRYNEEQKRVAYEPVKLPQEFRNFDFLSPWEGPDYPAPDSEEKTEKPEV
jgi:NADH-quinone oxidoreductase subunit C